MRNLALILVISGPKKLIEIVKNLIEINRDVDSREFSIMTVVKSGVNRLVDFLFRISDCFDLVYDVGEGRVWV